MESAVIAALVGFIAAIFGSAITLIVGGLTSANQVLEKGIEIGIKQELEYEKYLSKELQTIYGNCIHHLSRYQLLISLPPSTSDSKADQEILKERISAYGEAEKNLRLLLAYYPDRYPKTPSADPDSYPYSQEFGHFRTLIQSFSPDVVPDEATARSKELKEAISDLILRDVRLQLDSPKQKLRTLKEGKSLASRISSIALTHRGTQDLLSTLFRLFRI